MNLTAVFIYTAFVTFIIVVIFFCGFEILQICECRYVIRVWAFPGFFLYYYYSFFSFFQYSDKKVFSTKAVFSRANFEIIKDRQQFRVYISRRAKFTPIKAGSNCFSTPSYINALGAHEPHQLPSALNKKTLLLKHCLL